jgi:hypothetical protein
MRPLALREPPPTPIHSAESREVADARTVGTTHVPLTERTVDPVESSPAQFKVSNGSVVVAA